MPEPQALRARVGRAVSRTVRQTLDERVLVLASMLLVAICALALSSGRDADGIVLLCVVPIVLCANEHGVLGGVIASAMCLSLVVGWSVEEGGAMGPLGSGSLAVSYIVVGVIVGRLATERQTRERQLERPHQVAVDLQCTANFDGYFTRVNPAWEGLLGYSEKELLSLPYLALVHPEDRDRTRREAACLLGGEECTAIFENRYRARDGSYRWLSWTARSLPTERLIYASARDVTAVRAQRDALEHLVAERTRDLQAARLENLRRLALAAEYRDDDTHQHTERVGTLAALLAERLGEPRDFIEHLRHAAPLHDVGKIGVPDAILLKPGRLDETERAIMQTHTTIGANILADSGFPVLRLGEQIARSHHERWDGTGYPRGLTGDAIPLAGRIVAVADVFDALTHARPYKPAWPLVTAVSEIIAGAGSQFDPRVVAAFASLDRTGALGAFVADGPAGAHTLRSKHAVPV
jgi:PAS domain S-box-containing protein/putative nucleotidyltransferase with HDIG domain